MRCPAALAAFATCLAAAPVAAQDASLPPTFGAISVTSGFLPDPNWIRILAGGHIRGEYVDRVANIRCSGYFAEAPDFQVFFSPHMGLPLSFYVESREDTVLLVNTPDGEWHCNDDASAVNPALTFAAPAAGRYDIWVGTYDRTPADFPAATLAVTEGAPFAETFMRAFYGRDDRVEMEPTTAPWSMIGYLDVTDTACTGTLIGPATVLTAAHCITEAGDPTQVQFFAGYHAGRNLARATVVGYHVPAGWRDGRQGTDFAFVYLAQPIGEQVGWMEVTGLTDAEIAAYGTGNGPPIMQGGYSFDRPGRLTVNLDCPFVAVGPESTLIHQCDTLQGDSGSPLFIADGERYRIIGVESHVQGRPRDAFDRNVAMYADGIVAELLLLGTGTGTVGQRPGVATE